MKKIVSFLLVVLLIGMISGAVFVSETAKKTTGEVWTQETPDNIIKVAQTEIRDWLSSQLEGRMKGVYSHTYSLGHPINLKDLDSANRIYDFPVMRDGEIFAVFTIYDDNGEYHLQIEENMMASQFELMKKKGELSNITLLSMEEGLFAVTNDSVIPLSPDSELPEGLSAEEAVKLAEKSAERSTMVPVNISDPIMEFVLDQNAANTKATTSKIFGCKICPANR